MTREFRLGFFLGVRRDACVCNLSMYKVNQREGICLVCRISYQQKISSLRVCFLHVRPKIAITTNTNADYPEMDQPSKSVLYSSIHASSDSPPPLFSQQPSLESCTRDQLF